MTLAELLVASTILMVAIGASLALYDATWDSFETGEAAAEQQQGLRIAFDQLGLEVQMAGYNFNPDGDPSRSDEQIEAAFATARVWRGDFDGEVESTRAGDAYETVSTGNDEVVAYVLAKPDGSSLDSLRFEADMEEVPRDGESDIIDILGIDLVHDNPPYSLYRITFSPDASDWGTPDFVRREELAENVGEMTFRYYDDSGVQLNPYTLDDSSDDIGGSDLTRGERSRISRVEIDLLGLAENPDPQWFDPGDDNPLTRKLKKFRLTSSINARNLGLAGAFDTGGSVVDKF
jgi:hypothetical protein